MKAIIAGAGPGGLTAALFLHRIGWEVVICESVRKLKPLGVGINLLPHGTRELIVLGLAKEMERTGIQTRALEYRTQFGHLIYSDPRGLDAGFDFPAYSIHRGHLQFLLRNAVLERIGKSCIHYSCHFDSYEEDEDGVTARFIDKETGEKRTELRGDILIGADGIHSGVRQALHPGEGQPHYDGIMMWRGAHEREQFLDGRTMVIAGNHDLKVVLYPISAEAAASGRSLLNWVAEVRFDSPRPLNEGDWTRHGTLDFIGHFTGFELDFIDLEELFSSTALVYEYPMIDRDPLSQWSFGRVSLLGDAAHAMYPIGANGTSQAILDARALSDSLAETTDVIAGLQAYEAKRLGPTTKVVESNREYLSERYLDLADSRIRSRDDKIEDLISQQEIDDITHTYRRIAGFDIQVLNSKGLN
jgi:2-polyprenyl-6-methoxyphenol hydroxylase-like FAD-dependent oxidoreductase